ncbi:hypothetical protein [Streptosporangium sp. NPDC006007]|uniref:hypothetical protein n=1 Tax=Streptosporangium sp. NPDC006007 TaxID=3154575 RepID=UPI0033B03C81
MQSEKLISKEYMDLAKIQSREEEQLLSRRNVVGVALGNKRTRDQDTGEKAITVLVDSKLPKDMLSQDDLIPSKIGTTPTDVQEVGVIQAGAPLTVGGGQPVTSYLMPGATSTQPPGSFMTVSDLGAIVGQNGSAHTVRIDDRSLAALENVGPFKLTKRVRPAYGGVSVGHFQITAGTLSTCAYDASAFPGVPQRYYILSNNHVLANSNAAAIGDPILQPGPADGGTYPTDVIARLSRFVPIQFMHPNQPAPLNYVDAAVAEGKFEDLNREIYWVGPLRGLLPAPTLGLVVQKCGRTTNYTTGTVQNINATIDVNYGNGRVARFARQILTTNMSAPGDSGSLISDLEERAVGLLFAGSTAVTVINPITLVQQLLGIRVTE